MTINCYDIKVFLTVYTVEKLLKSNNCFLLGNLRIL